MTLPLGREDLSLDHSRKSYGVISDVDGLLDFPNTFSKDLPHLKGDKASQRLDFITQMLTNLPHDFASVWRSDICPLLPGFRGFLDRFIIVINSSKCDISDWKAIPRTVGGHSLATPS